MRRRIERKGRGMKILVIVTLVLGSAFISIDILKVLTKEKGTLIPIDILKALAKEKGTDSPKKCEDFNYD